MVSGASAEEIGNSKIAQLIDHFMAQVSEVTDAEDWVEADGWRGKWTIVGDDKETVEVYDDRLVFVATSYRRDRHGDRTCD
ncbi:hypothetical protein LCGC14_2690530 [marine sediment metagenome]|uniref:Uncharacterized protein n=1 Tax=marine sediment metagenome TaxID=412755 RepID=A0A0F9BTC0_9ZZZZ